MAEETGQAVSGIRAADDYERFLLLGTQAEVMGQRADEMDSDEKLAYIGWLSVACEETQRRQKELIERLELQRKTFDQVMSAGAATQTCGSCLSARGTRTPDSLSCRNQSPKLGETKWPLVRPAHWCRKWEPCSPARFEEAPGA